MVRHGKLAALFLVCSCVSPGGSNETQQVEQVLTEYFKGIGSRDLQKMNDHTTRDFILFEDGKVMTNDSLYAMISKFKKFEASYKLDDIEINVDVSSARCYYSNHGDFVIDDTTHVSRDWLESATFRKIKDQWRIEFLHSTVRK